MQKKREDIEQRFNELLPKYQPKTAPDIDVVDSVMERISALPNPKVLQRRRLQRKIGFITSSVTLAAAACVGGVLVFHAEDTQAQTTAPVSLQERLEDVYAHCYEYGDETEEAGFDDNPIAMFY